MIRKSILAGLAVIGLASAPAAANSAAADDAGVGGGKWLGYALLAGVVAVLAITIADGDDEPVSP